MTKEKKGKPTIKEQAVTKKHMPPSLPAIQHFQANKDPENRKNKQTTELTGKGGKDLFEGVTDEEMAVRIQEQEKKLGIKRVS